MGKSVGSSQVVGGLNRGAWTSVEDKTLIDYVKSHREGRWSNVAKVTGLRRCGKSCRLRWMNYLRPDIKRGNISSDEEDLILRLHKLLGNRWALIAGRLPGRTDNEIKNYWNTHLAKKAQDETKSTLFPGSPPNLAADDTNPLLSVRHVQPSFTEVNGGEGDHNSSPPHLIRDKNYDQSFQAPICPMKPIEAEYSSDRSSSPTCAGADVDESQPFMIDFNIDDIYNILNPEFARFVDPDGVVLADLNLNASVDPPGEGQRSDPDIRSLASFLESEAWLGLGDGDHVTGTCGDHDK